jgi:hypothetical protein
MNNIKLTIGIPTLPNRMQKYLEPLYAKLMAQIGDSKDIEVLALMDNKVISVGKKRTLLFANASGRYTCIIDDDDDVTDDFVATLRSVIVDDLDVDVICYDQDADMNGTHFVVKTSLDHSKELPYDQMKVDQFNNPLPCRRPPWHWCAWKTSFARQFPFGDSNTQEDTIFVRQAIAKAKTQIVLDKVLCKYRWYPSVSQAPFQHIAIDSVPLVRI